MFNRRYRDLTATNRRRQLGVSDVLVMGRNVRGAIEVHADEANALIGARRTNRYDYFSSRVQTDPDEGDALLEGLLEFHFSRLSAQKI
ncbi:MAG: hypothetical protein A2X94_13185 [Bdellovibrionales bacterium GWB1_55_8]|nr:MAG: hypothetical protein A2X94_13185 [Bdellovibrionales bacterium GWB1_55_8]